MAKYKYFFKLVYIIFLLKYITVNSNSTTNNIYNKRNNTKIQMGSDQYQNNYFLNLQKYSRKPINFIHDNVTVISHNEQSWNYTVHNGIKTSPLPVISDNEQSWNYTVHNGIKISPVKNEEMLLCKYFSR